MAIVAGFDVHRAQITFDALDSETGGVSRGRIDATPTAVAMGGAVCRPADRGRGRGVHRLAVRVRRAGRDRRAGAAGRAGADACAAGP